MARAVSTPRVTMRGTGLVAFWRRWGIYYLMMTPWLAIFATFTVLPVLAAAGLSLTYFNLLEPPRFIGLTNYRLLFVDDDIFYVTVRNTLYFAFITGPLGFFLSFFFAWLIHQVRGRAFFSIALYTPAMTSAIVLATFFKQNLFTGDQYGILNHLLISLGIIQQPIIWLQDQRTMMPVVIIVTLWASMNTGFLIWLAALGSVPQDLYEAGKIDGVRSRLQEMWYITLPSLKPQILLTSVLSIVAAFGQFQIQQQLAGLPSPLYAVDTIVMHMLDYAFIRFEMGYASAIAVVLFLVSFGCSRLLFRIFASDE
ncbi:MAG: sugar ABC transporter permease [Chloroflexi bacterium]|nr:sugar ABC transporter permease [Chloroflexota bacterium]